MFIALLSDLANKIKLIHFCYLHDVLRMRSNFVITIIVLIIITCHVLNLSICPQSDMHKRKAPMPQLPSAVVDDDFGKKMLFHQ